jgi:hypothetical protein
MAQDSPTVLPQSKVKKAPGELHGGSSEGYLGFSSARKTRSEANGDVER